MCVCPLFLVVLRRFEVVLCLFVIISLFVVSLQVISMYYSWFGHFVSLCVVFLFVKPWHFDLLGFWTVGPLSNPLVTLCGIISYYDIDLKHISQPKWHATLSWSGSVNSSRLNCFIISRLSEQYMEWAHSLHRSAVFQPQHTFNTHHCFFMSGDVSYA